MEMLCDLFRWFVTDFRESMFNTIVGMIANIAFAAGAVSSTIKYIKKMKHLFKTDKEAFRNNIIILVVSLIILFVIGLLIYWYAYKELPGWVDIGILSLIAFIVGTVSLSVYFIVQAIRIVEQPTKKQKRQKQEKR